MQDNQSNQPIAADQSQPPQPQHDPAGQQPIVTPPQSGSSALVIILISVGAFLFVIASIVVIVVIFSLVNKRSVQPGNTQPSTGMASTPDRSSKTPFTSSEHGFSIEFDSQPDTKRDSVSEAGQTIPLTQYILSQDSDTKAYLVQVGDYGIGEIPVSEQREMLQGAADGMASSDGYAMVSTTNNNYTEGQPSSYSVYTYTEHGESSDSYAVNIIKDGKLYTIITVGVNQADFDKFYQSFRFTD